MQAEARNKKHLITIYAAIVVAMLFSISNLSHFFIEHVKESPDHHQEERHGSLDQILLEITIEKDVYSKGETVQMEIRLVNNNLSCTVLHMFGQENRIFDVYITNSSGGVVWNNGFWGLPPPDVHYTLPLNASYFVNLSWDQTKDVKGGCVIAPSGGQVSSGEYSIHASVPVDRGYYRAELSSMKKIMIKQGPGAPQTGKPFDAPFWTDTRTITQNKGQWMDNPKIIRNSTGVYLIVFERGGKIFITASNDTISWSPPELVLENLEGAYEPWLIQNRAGLYCLFYSTSLGTYKWDIWLTTSNDLKTWSSKGKLPINSDTASDTYSRAIQDDKGIYRMIFGSYRPNRTNLWYTSSTDLTNWDEEKELNTAQGYQGWGEAYSPTLLQDSHGKYWVFWESFSNRLYNSSIESGIWFTSSSNFAEWNVPKKGSSPKLGKYEYRLDHH